MTRAIQVLGAMRKDRGVGWRTVAMMGVVAAGAARAGGPGEGRLPPTTAPANQRAAPTPEEIRRAVQQLNHPVPAKRRAAIRQLAEWGPLSYGELRRAASGADLEAALLARDLLAELASAILTGAEVRIEVDRLRINWDQPVTLTVYAHNPTAGPIRVPWPVPATMPASQPAQEEAAQVAALLDIADCLLVTGPDGQPIQLRVEPIDRDQAVFSAVNIRALGTPPSHPVEPGQTARLLVPLFNRGWARYPMLLTGKYTIAFLYQPQWKDASWTKEGFGLVRADPITVEVLQGAPEVIRQSSRPLALQLSRMGETLSVDVQNTWDRPLWVNLNLGSEPTVQGRLEWRLWPAGDREAEPLVLGPDATLPVVRPDQIRRIGPGETLTMARTAVATLRERMRQAGGKDSGTFELSAHYVHIATPDQLREYLRLPEEKAKVPTQLFSGTLSSDPVKLELHGEGE